MLTVRKSFSKIRVFFEAMPSAFIIAFFKLSSGLVQTQFFNLFPTFIKVVKTIEAGPLRLRRGRGMACNASDGCNDTKYKMKPILGHFQPITNSYNWMSAVRQNSDQFINY